MSTSPTRMSFSSATPISIRIVKLFALETGTYNPMYMRPYQTQYNADIEQQLQQRLASSGGHSTTAAMVAGLANQLITPSEQPTQMIQIPNGWETPRGRFALQVEVTYQTGTVQHYYFQGYTSHFDLSYAGTPDHDIIFIINGFHRVTMVQENTAVGVIQRQVLTESAQVINGRIVSSSANGTNGSGMRPQDIFNEIQRSYVVDEVERTFGHSQTVSDPRATIGTAGAISNNRANNMPAKYIAKLTNSWNVAQGYMEFGQGQSDVLGQASGQVGEYYIESNPFLRALATVTHTPTGTTFKIRDLENIDPNIRNGGVIHISKLGNGAISKVHHAGSTQYWHNPGDRTAWASTVLFNSIPVLMVELMITNIQFVATNQGPMGEPSVLITGATDMFAHTGMQHLEAFKTRFVNEIMNDLTYHNSETYWLTAHIDLFGDIWIEIQMGGSPRTMYVAPMFCDSLLTPNYTTDVSHLRAAANDFDKVLNSVANALQPEVAIRHNI